MWRMVVWGTERDMSARSRWCRDPVFCPAQLVSFLKSSAVGRTWACNMGREITLTVIGSVAQRAFAEARLMPVVLECVRCLALDTRPVHVTFCDACGDRLLPATPGGTISSEHVNGGMCMGTFMGVLVFRRQDAEKVLVHELLHLFDVDTPLRSLPSELQAHVARPLSGMWATISSTASTVCLSEAYTDAVACVVFCGLERARAHAVQVAVRVLCHFGMGRRPFLESTHVFSYYIVKAAMLVHARGFLSLLRSNGLTPKDPQRVARFMETGLRSLTFQAVAKSKVTRTMSMSMSMAMTDGAPGMVSFSHLQLK